MASTLVPGISFTIDLPKNYNNGKIPMLDTQVWTEPGSQGQGTKVRHTFYEKKMTSPLVFHNRGACGTKQKIITLAAET